MKIKLILVATALILLVIVGVVFFTRPNQVEQDVLASTYDYSKEYLLLRFRTDEILVNAEAYPDYETWDNDMTTLIQDWDKLAQEAQQLEVSTSKQAELAAINFELVQSAQAYTAKEITDIYDKAPRFKGIATLAQHLGVDAKRAQLILNQAQDETTAEGWTEAGDTLQKLETSAVVIKDGCKVAGYVGGVVITGGAAGGFAAVGTLTQVTTVVVGVDLALEVTEDSAQIAFGDKNKVSSFVKDVRTVTEPVASVLTITNIPSNLGTAYGKFESVMVGLDQFRESAQEGKVIGVNLTTFEYHPPFQVIKQTKYPGEVTVAEMERAEVEAWLQSLNVKQEPMTQQEVVDFLKTSTKEVFQEKASSQKANEMATPPNNDSHGKDDNSGLGNSGWKGTLESISGGNEEEQSTEFDFILNSDGTVDGSNFKKWTQEGDRLKLFGEDESIGYYEFKVSDDHIILTKMMIGSEVIEPGQEYMGGFAPAGVLYKKAGIREEESQTNKDALPISEFNEMSEDGMFKNIAMVTEKLGEPDVKTTDDKGRIIYVYYDLVKYDNGNLGSVKMAFYNEEDYRSYIEGMGASWESNQENWDNSGGGIRATEEIRGGDTYKNMYGN